MIITQFSSDLIRLGYHEISQDGAVECWKAGLHMLSKEPHEGKFHSFDSVLRSWSPSEQVKFTLPIVTLQWVAEHRPS